MKTINDVPVLLRREIEALMIAPFLDAFAEELGWEKTREIAQKVISALAEKSGRDAAERVGGNTLKHFEMVFPAFGNGGALEATLQQDEEGCLHMDVSKCAYADMYASHGLKELGALLSCERDEYFFKGFNPDIQFSRTHTIMGGCSGCDFRMCPQKDS